MMNTSSIQRVENNIAVIAELKKSSPNLAILKQYTGWGGLRDAMFTPAIYKKLKSYLSLEQIDSIKQTMTNAYYTPERLIEFIYRALALLDKPFNTILEPSAGHGSFFEHMPLPLKQNASVHGVELDEVSSALVQWLYPQVTLFRKGFEEYQPDVRFDLIIGNPPYGRELLQDKHHHDLSHLRIHHFFVAKSMRLLAPGGILAMVLPSYFLDNRKDHARTLIHQEGGRLLAAYRLPDNLFSDATVTVDVVFLEKNKDDNQAWLLTEKKRINQEVVFINRYFKEHPTHVLGELTLTQVYGRSALTCQHHDVDAMYAMLFRHLDVFPPKPIPKLDDYQRLLADKMRCIDKELDDLMRLKSQIGEVQNNLHFMQQQFVQQCVQQLNLNHLLHQAL